MSAKGASIQDIGRQNIARVTTAVQRHEFMFPIVRIVICVSNVKRNARELSQLSKLPKY